MGINTADENGGSNNPYSHCPLILDCLLMYFYKDMYFIHSANGNFNKECGDQTTSPC
jgi:hypothetical protein